MKQNKKVVQFKALKKLHDSGFRLIEIKDQDGKIVSPGSDVIHLRLGGVMGSWLNIDCQKDGTFRIFCFPSPEGPEFEIEKFPMSSCFIDVTGAIRIGEKGTRKYNVERAKI